MRNLLAFAVILLSISVTLVQGITAHDNSGFVNTIYVDDDNTEGPWDGSAEYPYQFIQDGIDNASDGDTIFVFNGIYYENVVIDKSIGLIGEKNLSTIINCLGGKSLTIKANDVQIENFSVINGRNSGIRIDGTYNNSIKNCICYDNYEYGIEIVNSSYNLIENCISYNNSECGITLPKSSYNTIINCSFFNNSEGIRLQYQSNNNNVINCISNLNRVVGIKIDYSDNNSINNCSLQMNEYGILIWTKSQNNLIEHCSIFQSYESSIYIRNSNDCLIVNNVISQNGNNGIFLFESNNNSVLENVIETSLSGIYILHSNQQDISYNTIVNCSNGLYIEESYNNLLNKNNIIINQEGIFCSYAPDNIFEYNNFISNEENAKFTKLCHKDFMIPNKWRYNYWDDGIGFGVKIIPGIMYIPNDNLIGIFIPWIEIDWHPAKEPYELAIRIEVGPYTQNVNDDSITIAWETNIPTTDNYVMFGETTDYEQIIHGESDCCHHEITITPSFSLGYYKVVSDNEESNDLTFKLASHCHTTHEFKCILIGDSRGTWDNWEHAAIVANAVNNEAPDFVIHGGDMVDDGRIQTQWDSWLTLMKPLMQNSTVFGVMGNHERKGSRYYEIFALPNNEKWYCFDYGPCHFIVLDNYELWNVGSSQYEWLEEDLQTTDKPFKIICFHEPIYCSGGHSPRTDVRDVWEPLFNKYNVNLVFQSHCHYYQRTNDINGTTYIVSGGAGAPLYAPKDAWFVNNSQKAYHYCVLDVSLATMEITFSARYVNGTTFDEFIVCPPVVS